MSLAKTDIQHIGGWDVVVPWPLTTKAALYSMIYRLVRSHARHLGRWHGMGTHHFFRSMGPEAPYSHPSRRGAAQRTASKWVRTPWDQEAASAGKWVLKPGRWAKFRGGNRNSGAKKP